MTDYKVIYSINKYSKGTLICDVKNKTKHNLII